MTLNKARARISLGLFEKMWEYRQEINPDFLALSAPPITDELVQKRILTPLLNLRKKHPTEYRNQTVNLEGLCHILGISLDRFLFNVSLLQEEGMIQEEGEKEGLGLETGRFFITSRGVRHLSSTRQTQVSRPFFQELNKEGSEVPGEFEYDVAISFAREDWELIEKLTGELKNRRIRVFYDTFEDSVLWSKSLHEYLSYLHGHLARVCLLVLSRHYAFKNWIDHERVTAQAKIIRDIDEFILPLRVDGTVIPGMKESIGYIPVTDVPIDRIAELILTRLVDSYI
jgi:hypothetical protein